MKSGLSPGAACGQSGAAELQLPPCLPFDNAAPPHTGACGRAGSTSHALLVLLDARRVLADLEVYKSAAGHLVTYSTISA
eukprot:8611311-Lingulodinium_polyedra.AAC.1